MTTKFSSRKASDMTERVYLYKNRGRNGLKIEANIEINLLLFFSGDVEKQIHVWS
jgi:hypothetical protein